MPLKKDQINGVEEDTSLPSAVEALTISSEAAEGGEAETEGGKGGHKNDVSDEDDDEDLFKTPPPKEVCPVCFLPLHNKASRGVYPACCGKTICDGCTVKAIAIQHITNIKRAAKDPPEPPLELTCAFCRELLIVTDEENAQQVQKRMAQNDAAAINSMAGSYVAGHYDLPRDMEKACELFRRAAHLGSAEACWNLAREYREGGYLAGQNESKKIHYLKLAAKRGHVRARRILGYYECEQGNLVVAVKHWVISAAAGDDESLKNVGLAYRKKAATKIQYENAIRAHQKAKEEMSSDERDMAKKIDDAGGDFSVLSETELKSLFGEEVQVVGAAL